MAGAVNDHIGPVGQVGRIGDKAGGGILLDFAVEIELVGIVVSLHAVGGEAAPVLQSLVVVAVIVGAHIHQVPGTVRLLLQGPLGQGAGPVLRKAQAVALLTGGQECAVQLEGVDAFGDMSGEKGHLLGEGNFAVLGGGGSLADELAVVGGGGKRHAGGGMVDHDLVAVSRGLGELGKDRDILGLLGGLGFHSAAELPEAHGLILDVAGNIVVAVPVDSVAIGRIDAQIPSHRLAVGRGQIGAGGVQIPDRIGRADAHAVVGIRDIELAAVRGSDLVTALNVRDLPADLVGCGLGAQGGAGERAGLEGQGLTLAAGAVGGQHIVGTSHVHGDRNGVLSRDVFQRDLFPGGNSSRRKRNRRHEGEHHGDQQNN